jgi:hypothetical protein
MQILGSEPRICILLGMAEGTKAAAVPAAALLQPTLLLTGKSAAAFYAQPAPELKRLTAVGAVVKIARGYYAAVPIGKQSTAWVPSMEDLAAGLASAVYGPGRGALWGLSAARAHGAIPRAVATGYAFGPTQHRPIELLLRQGEVQFSKRNPERLDVEYLDTELGPGLVTSVAQTILDLSTRHFEGEGDLRREAVRNLMNVVDLDELVDLATRARGLAALNRARQLASHAQ